MTLESTPTPRLLVDVERARQNISRVQDAANGHGVRVRPHIKTHKSPVLAQWQIDAGAIGVCAAKPGEAMVMAEAGIGDILLAYPLQPSALGRLRFAMDRARVAIAVDNLDVARAWSRVLVDAGSTLDVLVKVDVGTHRVGIDPGLPGAADIIEQVAMLPGVVFRGVLSHAGHAYGASAAGDIDRIVGEEAALLGRIGDECRRRRIPVETISIGSTPGWRASVAAPGVTELRIGTYIFNDRTQVALGSATLDQCALTVLATVVSRPSRDRVVLDCGSKTLSSDAASGFSPQPGYGLVYASPDADAPDPNLLVVRLSEEHAVVSVTGGASSLQPGDRVRVLPNHCCPVVNLAEDLVLVEGSRVVDVIPVAARAKVF